MLLSYSVIINALERLVCYSNNSLTFFCACETCCVVYKKTFGMRADLSQIKYAQYHEFTQEALLPQTDRAMHYVRRNLVNCIKKLYNKSTTNRKNGVRGLQLTRIKQPRLGLSYRCRQQTRPSRTTRSTCRGEIKSGVWDKVPEGSTLIFGDSQISLQHSVG